MNWNATAAGTLALLGASHLQAPPPATCLMFKPPVSVETGLFASGVVIEDFNADGAADLAVTNQNSNNVSVLLGDGTGAFKRKTDIPAGGGA